MSNQKIIELIREGKHSLALDVLYKNFPAFRNKFIKEGGKASDAEDIFQDALLIFIEKVSDIEFELTCSVNSFLFSICRNLSYEYYRKKGKEMKIPLESDEDYYDPESTKKFVEREQRYKALDRILTSIGKKCMEILSLFYINGLNMDAISQRMGFKSVNSAKTQKYKCIEKARKYSNDVLLNLQAELV